MAPEYIMGGHGRRGAISPAWSWNSYAWEIVLTITQKVLCLRSDVGVLVSSIILNHYIGKKWFVYLFWTEPLPSQRRNMRRNSWRRSSWETNCVRKRHSNCRSCWREWVSSAKLTENDFTEPLSNPSPTWLSLRGFVNTLLDRITNYSNSLQSNPGQLATDSYERDPLAKVNSLSWSLFWFLGPGKISAFQNQAKINICCET